jgi:hypothetical protein
MRRRASQLEDSLFEPQAGTLLPMLPDPASSKSDEGRGDKRSRTKRSQRNILVLSSEGMMEAAKLNQAIGAPHMFCSSGKLEFEI